MFGFGRKKRADHLVSQGFHRRIRIHSVVSVPEGDPRPSHMRVAFEFLDPPGPWSMQFYESTAKQPEVIAQLQPGTEAKFYESEDGAKTRILTLQDGTKLWPR